MHKNALFLLKNNKNRPALGACFPNPLWSPAAGEFVSRRPQDPTLRFLATKDGSTLRYV